MMPESARIAWNAARRAAQRCAATGVLLALTTASSLAQDAEPATAPLVGAAALPRDLSPIGMFQSADTVVKGVLILLAVASVITWTICLAKVIEIIVAKDRARVALR